MLWHDDHLQEVTTVITAIRMATNCGSVSHHGHRGAANGLEGSGHRRGRDDERETRRGKRRGKEPEQRRLPATLAQGQAQNVARSNAKEEDPAAATIHRGHILTAMQTAGKRLDEKELSDAMKETGLGTPATRAAIIEVLLKRGYITRTGKSLEATDKGIHLIEVVHPEVKSPAMTGQWEAFLNRIQQGEAQLDPFIERIGNYVRSVVSDGCARLARKPRGGCSRTHPRTPIPHESHNGKRMCSPFSNASLNFCKVYSGFPASVRTRKRFAGSESGEDALLVMPTGSGKSLCYQLPGLARGGTTLVISPLIALMDDQVRKLKDLGLSAECIHSGRDRETSRRVCVDYLNGSLQFLFIAPERLRVAGFPEMLAKRKPSLIAIDEAHCISQWGHDFRPDYRMLGQYLPSLRPAPALALTATATPQVQKDIAASSVSTSHIYPWLSPREHRHRDSGGFAVAASSACSGDIDRRQASAGHYLHADTQTG